MFENLSSVRLLNVLFRKAPIDTQQELVAAELSSVLPISLLAVMVSPIYNCNRRCFFCDTHSHMLGEGEYADAANAAYYPEFKKDRANFTLPFDTYEKLIPDLVALGVKSIDISGVGEPMLHPRTIDMVALAARSGISVLMTSNGSLISPEKFDNLVGAGLSSLTLSINSLDPILSQKMHGLSDDKLYNQLFRLLGHISRRKLSGLKMDIAASFAISKLNMGEVDQWEDFRQKYNIDRINYTPINSQDFDRDLGLDATDIEMVIGAAERSTGRNIPEIRAIWHNCNFKSEFDVPCFIGSRYCWIGSNGDVFGCGYSTQKLGSLRDNTFLEIWRSNEYIQFRRDALTLHQHKQPPACTNCGNCPGANSDFEALGPCATKARDRINIIYGISI